VHLPELTKSAFESIGIIGTFGEIYPQIRIVMNDAP
jgi:hypothetical protein